MIKIFNITNRTILAFVAAFILVFVLVGLAHAQENVSITFPITELGGCNDYASCRIYCDDPVNADTCVNFAKSKGFYKEDALQTQQAQVLVKAKTALGCDSETACLNFCEIPANYDKCHAFAQSNNLSGGIVTKSDDRQILAKAQQALGCTSENSCKSFCGEEINKQKCADFAKEAGLRGGKQRVGPGGCNSEATCTTFCSNPDNFQVCSGFASVAGTTFSGPGGCNSESLCKTYCQQHPDDCKGFGGGSTGGTPSKSNPAEMCNRTPNCSWTGSTCQCGFYGETNESAKKAAEYASYCAANPDKCKPGQGRNVSNPQAIQEFERFCSQNPAKCQPTSTNQGISNYQYHDPATECVRYGCSWIGNNCQCIGIGSNPSANQGDSASICASKGGTWTGNDCNLPADAKAQGCTSVGGTWKGNYCEMPKGTNPYNDPTAACTRSGSGCYWTGTSCYCPPSNQSGLSGQSGSSGGNHEDPATACTRGGGCTWTGTRCDCPSSSGSSGGNATPPPPAANQGDSASICASKGGTWTGNDCNLPADAKAQGCTSVGGTWMGSYCKMPESTPPPSSPAPSGEVHGVSTTTSILQAILNFLKGR